MKRLVFLLLLLAAFTPADTPSVYWDDIVFPAVGINPIGAPSPPTVDATTGCLVFANGATNIVALQVQLPHAWMVGTAVNPHVHWHKATSAGGTVKWQSSYSWGNIGTVYPGFSVMADGAVRQTDGDTAQQQAIMEWTWSGAGKTMSSIILIQIHRLSSGGSADTYAGNALLCSFDVHIMKDAPGSRSEYVK